MTGFTDIHSHFIYGLDDGARTRADMEAMLDAAKADGISALFATPHIVPGMRPFDFDRYYARLAQARGYCAEREYGIRIYSGAEIMYTPAMQRRILDHMLPTLADSKYALIEFLPEVALDEMDEALGLMERGGYVPIIAHIERYKCLLHGRNAEKLKERYDLRYQVNANTILNERGFLRTRHIRNWFSAGLIDHIASDAHNLQLRPYRMRAAYELLVSRYGGEYAMRLAGVETADAPLKRARRLERT